MRALGILLVVAACGGESKHAAPDAMPLAASGFEGSRALSDLSPSERTQYCAWELTALGGAGFTRGCESCDGDACTDWNVTINTQAQCETELASLASCGITVGADESCVIDQAADLCSGPASCQPLDACL